jgi:hypothetical protein
VAEAITVVTGETTRSHKEVTQAVIKTKRGMVTLVHGRRLHPSSVEAGLLGLSIRSHGFKFLYCYITLAKGVVRGVSRKLAFWFSFFGYERGINGVG